MLTRLFRAIVAPGIRLALLSFVPVACGVSDVLDVAPPVGTQTASALDNRSGAEGVYVVARSFLFGGLVGGTAPLTSLAGLLTDEFSYASLLSGPSDFASIDARRSVSSSGSSGLGNGPLSTLLQNRSALLLAARGLQRYEPSNEQWLVGEAWTLVGYAELFLAEAYCAGVPLSRTLPDVGYEYGKPLTTDSLFAVAQMHFDSALAYAGGNATIKSFASVGRARALLGRGRFSEAAAAVANVPTDFAYDMETPAAWAANTNPNVYQQNFLGYCSQFNVSDREGGTGLNFVSAHDPRLVLSTSVGSTCDARYGGSSVLYYPMKFGVPSTEIPIATGVEARLIEAEAALHDNQIDGWANTLNTLRAQAPATYLHLADTMPHLTPDSTTGGSADERVDVMFRERAFWLFGTGTRLGDLRRLVRQYGRAASTVFPTGTYASGALSSLSTYGTDISLTLPTAASGTTTTNPYYVGCLDNTN